MDQGIVGNSGRAALLHGSDPGSGLLIAEDNRESQGAVRINVRAFTFR